jgi:Zn-dependent M16 (insulinase) family peptidase
MNKINVDEDWYTLDSVKQIKNIEQIKERQDELHTRLDTIETKLNSTTTLLSTILHRLETMEQRHNKENIAITNALHELHTIKEREINIMIRERIPFPFGLPKLHSTTPNGLVRKPFSNGKKDSMPVVQTDL